MTPSNPGPAAPPGRVPPVLSRRDLLRRAGVATAGTLAGGVAINAAAPLLFPESREVDPNRSYWARALPPVNQPLERSIDADVAIIGGGFTGLSAAYHLGQLAPGRRVVLLEARGCGNGASGRNGAMLLTSTADRWLTPSDAPDIDRRITAMTVENIGAIRDLSSQFGLDVELETRGAVQVLNTPAEVQQARGSVARLKDSGIAAEFWDADRVREGLGTGAYPGALFDAASGQVHPGKLVALFKMAAMSVGVDIYENTRVTSVDEGRVHAVTTAAGQRVRAPLLVLATNAYSSQLGYLRSAYVPILAYVGITPPLDAGLVADLGWQSRAPFNDSRTDVYYLGLGRDNRVRIGGGPAGYGYRFNNGVPPPQVPAAIAGALHAALAQIFPALANVPLETCWSGAVDCSLNFSPALGRMGRHGNIYYAIGYSGHGVNLASTFGRIIADLIAGHGERWRWLPCLNQRLPYIPNEPLRWLGVRAYRAAIGVLEP